MGNCASEPKTKGDDSSAAPAPAPAPEPRKEESLQTEEVIDEQRVENKTDDGDADHNKQPSLGALLKEEEEKACDNLAKSELEAEEKPKTTQSQIEETLVSAAVTQEDKKTDNIEEKKPELKETEPENKDKEIIEPAEEKEMIAKPEEDQKEIIVKPAKEKKIIEPAEEKGIVKPAGEGKEQI